MENKEACKLGGLKTLFSGIDCADDASLCLMLALIENHKIGDPGDIAKQLHKAIAEGDVLGAFHLGERVARLMNCILYKEHFEKPVQRANKMNTCLATNKASKAAADAIFHNRVREWVQTKMDGSKRLSLTGARVKAASEFNRTVRQIIRITKGMKTPKRK